MNSNCFERAMLSISFKISSIFFKEYTLFFNLSNNEIMFEKLSDE